MEVCHIGGGRFVPQVADERNDEQDGGCGDGTKKTPRTSGGTAVCGHRRKPTAMHFRLYVVKQTFGRFLLKVFQSVVYVFIPLLAHLFPVLW